MWQQMMAIALIISSLFTFPSTAQVQNDGPWSDAMQELSPNFDPNTDPRMLRSMILQMLNNQQSEQSQEERPVMAPPIGEDDMVPTAISLRADDKRSYMALCHFKICNMGRKRNLRPAGWVRL